MARARTGSGKTFAYLLPALHRVLAGGKGRAGWQALVLVPTRELCEQVREEAASVAALCGADLSATAIAGDAPLRAACATAGQIVVTTPAKLAQVRRRRVAAVLRAAAVHQLGSHHAESLHGTTDPGPAHLPAGPA